MIRLTDLGEQLLTEIGRLADAAERIADALKQEPEPLVPLDRKARLIAEMEGRRADGA